MKKCFKFVAISFAILAFACSRIDEVDESPMYLTRDLTFIASWEAVSPTTKTVRMDDGSTWWNASEEISVFYGSGTNGGSKFTSLNTTLQETVEFSGSMQMTGSWKDFWAVYPYDESNACDGSSITTVIPDVQTGSEGNFSGDAFPAIAKSNTNVFAFWNICGGVKFFVSRSDIKSITFKGNGGEVLAGKVRVVFNTDGKPEVAEVLDGKAEVTLNAPDGGTFKAGKYYYLTLLPTALDGGFTMTFNTADSKGVVTSDKPQTVKRSIFGVLKNIDSKVPEWETTLVVPELVDLGLPSGIKWASFNLGATKPEEYGDYFAWGETCPKTDYSWLTYKWCASGDSWNTAKFSKYCPDSYYGTVDNKTVLDIEDDAAWVNLGGYWRMPTDEECTELRENCSWTVTDNYDGTGVKGRIVTSNISGYTDKSIFLPAAGGRGGTDFYYVGKEGYYWSSSLILDSPYYGWSIMCLSQDVVRAGGDRSFGFSVRPVYDDRIHPESVSLNKSSLSLYVGCTEHLTATVLPDYATVKTVMWSSDNTGVATVDEKGNVRALKAGLATITVTTLDGAKTATCTVTVIQSLEPQAIDLGLPSGLKWASWNVGASSPEECGDYFAWGETVPKEEYSWQTYKFELGYGENGPFSKYVTEFIYDPTISYGTVDNKTVLDSDDDAASVNWGGSWRMPTDAEFTELRENCTWTWTTQNGVNGRLVTGSNYNSIFLPAAGLWGSALYDVGDFGFYWSSSLRKDQPAEAFSIKFNYDSLCQYIYGHRCQGFSVRPVTE